MEIDKEEPQNLNNAELEEQLIVSEIITPLKAAPATHPLDNFMETFGAWDDERTTEEIVEDIYNSRTDPWTQHLIGVIRLESENLEESYVNYLEDKYS